jgi:hypothetical protein
MRENGTIYLIYHELELPGRNLCQSEPGYQRYVVMATEFRQHLASLRAGGFRGMSVGKALRGADRELPSVAITFDDGCETDLLSAAPLLLDAGFDATFYVVMDFLGRPGYLSHAQLRELSSAGFEIGCHSMTHVYLSDLSPEGLRFEIAGAKEKLEQLLGKPVEHFSCPGGRWSRKVAQEAQATGFRSVATSRIGANAPVADRFRLARVAVLRGTQLGKFERLCRVEGLLLPQIRDAILSAAKGVLGNTLYDKVWSLALGGGQRLGPARRKRGD